MTQEELVLRQLFGNLFSAGETWIAVVYLAGMFTVAAFRPQQIAIPRYFRLSYVFFAFYFIAPSLIEVLLNLSLADLDRVDRSRVGASMLLQVPHIVAKILLGVTVVIGLSSLRRRPAGEASIPPELARAMAREAIAERAPPGGAPPSQT
jgi:hypothetical protein